MEDKQPVIMKWPCPKCQKEQEVIQLVGTYVQCTICKEKFVIYLQELPKSKDLEFKDEKSCE